MKLKSCFVIMTYDVILAPNLGIKERNKKIKKRKNREIESRKPSPTLSVLTLSPLQDFFSGETDFYFCQFLSNFLKFSFSNFLSSHPYNILAVYFPSNSPLLKSLLSALSNFSYFCTSVFSLLLNSAMLILHFINLSPSPIYHTLL